MLYTIDISGQKYKEFNSLEEVIVHINHNQNVFIGAFVNGYDHVPPIKITIEYNTEPSSRCNAKIFSLLQEKGKWLDYYLCHNSNQDSTEDQDNNSFFMNIIKSEINKLLDTSTEKASLPF